VLRWLVYHLAELDLYLGVLPFAAFLLLLATARTLDGRARIFVAASVSLAAWLVLQVATFASTVPVPPRVEERNLFYVAPLFLIALLVWIERGLPRPGARRARRLRLVGRGQARAAPALGERVLQPQRRARVRPARAVAGHASRDAAHAGGGRPAARRRRSGCGALRARRPSRPS